jgi:hypothetical protein
MENSSQGTGSHMNGLHPDAKARLDHTREAFDEVSEMASEFYSRASHWLEGNYGKAVGAVAVLAAVGFLGFYLGKSSNARLPELRDL